MTGNGGDAGRIRLYFSKLRGEIALETCRGKGGQAAKNGLGGAGKSINDNRLFSLDTFLSVLFHGRVSPFTLCYPPMLTSFPLTSFSFLDFLVAYLTNGFNASVRLFSISINKRLSK